MISPTRRDRVTFGRIFARVERTLSIRLTVPAVSLPYPQPLPDIDPEASNTIMASSVQGECSSWPVVARPPNAGTAAAVKAIAATLQERVDKCIVEILAISSMCHKPTFLEAIELSSSGSKKGRSPDGGDGASSVPMGEP